MAIQDDPPLNEYTRQCFSKQVYKMICSRRVFQNIFTPIGVLDDISPNNTQE